MLSKCETEVWGGWAQVERKDGEMAQVMKRMARKVRQAWQQHEQQMQRRDRQRQDGQTQPEPEPEPTSEPAADTGTAPQPPELPEWLEPRDGESFLQLDPLRHCGLEPDASWRQVRRF